ncbi:hypothetical protein PC129_g21496 [Phytophthora cactorum]|uniref:Uncharacterized protein n=1 Tax=Phytophthora cactorum TaxID=29920 RepID=A0A8T1AJF3_9STRA|nr:hypothetical protein Pcac1_g17111 [Phytophthora cactorum]KAG2875610.1 hypothetical protein PC114_g24622 [Phytophthora cactorum]KAG2882589.1 hypothetical protein PC115_g21903 [Phytophthora cactorum]KAG3053802.1 hypothetical protein PC122_g22226 [Phytophthora cactorum]KAG3207292.1 hypothetical protein PC129_g21496 [Phytophthora cactorum]
MTRLRRNSNPSDEGGLATSGRVVGVIEAASMPRAINERIADVSPFAASTVRVAAAVPASGASRGEQTRQVAAPGPGKRRRPRGSKNKPKDTDVAAQSKPKRSRTGARPTESSNPRRSKVLTSCQSLPETLAEVLPSAAVIEVDVAIVDTSTRRNETSPSVPPSSGGTLATPSPSGTTD